MALFLPELALLAGASYCERQRIGRWERVHTIGGRGDAFRATLWDGPARRPLVLAVRGTAGWLSGVEDLRLLLGREPRAWRRGAAALEKLRARCGRRILLTGHSLGGAYATALALETGLRALVFNAPGMRGVLPHDPARDRTARVLNVRLARDWIHLLSGPSHGRSLLVGSGEAPRVRSGLRGLLDAMALRSPGEPLLGFCSAALRDHRIDVLRRAAGWSSARTASVVAELRERPPVPDPGAGASPAWVWSAPRFTRVCPCGSRHLGVGRSGPRPSRRSTAPNAAPRPIHER